MSLMRSFTKQNTPVNTYIEIKIKALKRFTILFSVLGNVINCVIFWYSVYPI